MLNLRFMNRTNNPASVLPFKKAAGLEKARTLAQAQPGKPVTISGFDKLAPSHRQHLQAYGLLPGRTVQVLAQRPVTIVLVEQTELAFETEIAKQVLID